MWGNATGLESWPIMADIWPPSGLTALKLSPGCIRMISPGFNYIGPGSTKFAPKRANGAQSCVGIGRVWTSSTRVLTNIPHPTSNVATWTKQHSENTPWGTAALGTLQHLCRGSLRRSSDASRDVSADAVAAGALTERALHMCWMMRLEGLLASADALGLGAKFPALRRVARDYAKERSVARRVRARPQPWPERAKSSRAGGGVVESIMAPDKRLGASASCADPFFPYSCDSDTDRPGLRSAGAGFGHPRPGPRSPRNLWPNLSHHVLKWPTQCRAKDPVQKRCTRPSQFWTLLPRWPKFANILPLYPHPTCSNLLREPTFKHSLRTGRPISARRGAGMADFGPTSAMAREGSWGQLPLSIVQPLGGLSQMSRPTWGRSCQYLAEPETWPARRRAKKRSRAGLRGAFRAVVRQWQAFANRATSAQGCSQDVWKDSFAHQYSKSTLRAADGVASGKAVLTCTGWRPRRSTPTDDERRSCAQGFADAPAMSFAKAHWCACEV